MSATTTTTITAPAAPTSSLNTQTSGGQVKRLHNIPKFTTKEAERQWQLEQLAGAFRIFAKLGFADGGSGHISLRGELGNKQAISLTEQRLTISRQTR